jgi:hypothetical protein
MKPPRTLVAAALAGALLCPTSPADAREAAHAAPAAARLNSQVTIHPFYHQQKYRHTFRISGQVRYSEGADVYAKAGVQVSLLRRPAGSTRWSRIGTDKTSQATKPTYKFSVVARTNSTYRVRFAGTKRLEPSQTNAKVYVHRRVPTRLLRPRPHDLKLAGHVEPAWRHNQVRLVKRGCKTCNWHVVRRQRTSGTSHFKFSLDAPRKGSSYYRVQVPGTVKYASSVSATYRTYR